MLDRNIYRGPPIEPDETVVIEPGVTTVIFPDPLDLRGMIYSDRTEVMLAKGGRIRHLKCGGMIGVQGDLYAGSIEARSDILVNGNLSTWLGDVKSAEGNICVTGDIRAAGSVMAPMGSIAVSGVIEKEGRLRSLDTWTGASGFQITPMALGAAKAAETALLRLSA